MPSAARPAPSSRRPRRRAGVNARHLVLLAALGKQHELKGHVRGALNNGATAQEIQEVLLHTSIYCGVPTAVDAFRSAAEVIDGPKKPA